MFHKNKYITYIISYHIISYIISYHIISYHIISYQFETVCLVLLYNGGKFHLSSASATLSSQRGTKLPPPYRNIGPKYPMANMVENTKITFCNSFNSKNWTPLDIVIDLTLTSKLSFARRPPPKRHMTLLCTKIDLRVTPNVVVRYCLVHSLVAFVCWVFIDISDLFSLELVNL